MVPLTKWCPIGWSSPRASSRPYSWFLLLGLCKWSCISHNLGIILNCSPFSMTAMPSEMLLWVCPGSNHQSSLKSNLLIGFRISWRGRQNRRGPRGLPCCRPSCETTEKLPDLRDQSGWVCPNSAGILSLNMLLKALVNVILGLFVREHLVEFTATLHP